MANQDAAFGLKPLGKIGQSADNNAATEYEVAAVLQLLLKTIL